METKKRERVRIDGKRYDITTAINLGYETQEVNGVRTCRTLLMPSTSAIVTETYSRVDRGDGKHVGRDFQIESPGSDGYETLHNHLKLMGCQFPET